MLTIRPSTPADLEALLEVRNDSLPPVAMAQFMQWEQERPADLPYHRWIALDETGVARGYAVAWRGYDTRAGHLTLTVRVHSDYRRRGVGRGLHAAALSWAREQGADCMEASARIEDEPAQAFMAATGWREIGQVQFSRLDLSGFDVAPYRGAMKKAQEQGFRFVTLAELGLGEAGLAQYHAFVSRLEQDIPGRGPLTPPYAVWRERVVAGQLDWRPEHTLLALHGHDWAAVSAVELEQDGAAYTAITAVERAHRGAGLGMALKVAALELALKLGATSATTYNHTNNAPMLAVNAKFGYVPEYVIGQFEFRL
jgi:GNAT superfamily N-acetyltransferase